MILNRQNYGLGKAISAVRHAKELSLEILAKRSGVRQNDLKKIEDGEKSASLLQIHSIAKAMDVKMIDLLEKSNEIIDQKR